MKKIIISLIIIITLFITVGKLVSNNYNNLKKIYKLYKEQSVLVAEKEKIDIKLKKVKVQTIVNDKLIKIPKNVKNYIKKRYLFKYQDYQALNIYYFKKIKDKKSKKFYYKIKLRFSVRKSGTLFSILNLMYRDPNIYKIFLKDRNNMVLYFDQNKILNKINKKVNK